jgi:dATP pyrophosphohydrolase
MARAPFQVLVYPYRKVGDTEYEYALLRRSDEGWWQAIAGGGEDNETPLEAARRETREETGIALDTLFLQLDTIEPVRVTEFRDNHFWGADIYVIPQYCFGVLVQDGQITLSHEHTDYQWLTYDEAYNLLKYDGNRTALWELNQRLRGK